MHTGSQKINSLLSTNFFLHPLPAIYLPSDASQIKWHNIWKQSFRRCLTRIFVDCIFPTGDIVQIQSNRQPLCIAGLLEQSITHKSQRHIVSIPGIVIISSVSSTFVRSNEKSSLCELFRITRITERRSTEKLCSEISLSDIILHFRFFTSFCYRFPRVCSDIYYHCAIVQHRLHVRCNYE